MTGRRHAWGLLGVTLLLLTRVASGAVVAGRVTVDTTPTVIAQTASDVRPVLLKNTGAASVYIGGATVTTTSGYELSAGETMSITLYPEEAVYGVVVTGTVVVHKLENRR